MKFVMIIALVSLCTYVGYGFSKYYINRNEFFKEFILFLNKVNLNINFSKEKLKNIIDEYKTQSKELILILKNFLLCLEERSINEKKLFAGTKLLKSEEKNILLGFFSSLGHFDLAGQTKHLESFIKEFEIRQKQAEDEKNKYSPLFTKLGLIAGVVISLILL